MQNLINDIFTISKISSGKDTMEYCDLNELINDVIQEMETTIQEKKAEITVEKLPRLYVHKNLIKRLFQNLISNSIKYSKKDLAPVIRISGKIEASEEHSHINRYCRIYVQDNGVGFDQQYSEQVFTMFKRLHVAPEYEGTGIGLAICKKIVEEHKGFISVKSEVNRGTLFTISLPVSVPETVSPFEKENALQQETKA
jgi:light-regulated signal transduction histidine kinase (bacteriophytochrome)